jgi:hypothetical protein
MDFAEDPERRALLWGLPQTLASEMLSQFGIPHRRIAGFPQRLLESRE